MANLEREKIKTAVKMIFLKLGTKKEAYEYVKAKELYSEEEIDQILTEAYRSAKIILRERSKKEEKIEKEKKELFFQIFYGALGLLYGLYLILTKSTQGIVFVFIGWIVILIALYRIYMKKKVDKHSTELLDDEYETY